MADSFAQSIFKDFKFPRFSGKLSSFEQPVKFKVVSPPRYSIEDGSSVIAVPSKSISSKHPIFSKISGKLSSFEQLSRQSFKRDFNLQMLVEILSRIVQCPKSKYSSLARQSIDEGHILLGFHANIALLHSQKSVEIL